MIYKVLGRVFRSLVISVLLAVLGFILGVYAYVLYNSLLIGWGFIDWLLPSI